MASHLSLSTVEHQVVAGREHLGQACRVRVKKFILLTPGCSPEVKVQRCVFLEVVVLVIKARYASK